MASELRNSNSRALRRCFISPPPRQALHIAGSDVLKSTALSFPPTDCAKILPTELEPRSGAAAILIDEVDTRLDQHGSDATQSFWIGPAKTGFELFDRLQLDRARLREAFR